MGSAPLSISQQPQLYGVIISTYTLALISVCLRLAARKVFSKAGFWLDDYAILASLTIATGDFIDMIIWIRRGLGRHIELYGMAGITHFYTSLFVREILYAVSLCLTKYSILLFYLRIFGRTSIRIAVKILALVVTGWAIAAVITTIFQCTPVQGFWDKSINPTCSVNIYAFFIGNAIPNIITDWALLLLPIPYIWRLHQSKAQKTALCGVFGLGGFICIISIIRLYIMTIQLFRTSSTDTTWIFIGSSTWTAVEIDIGIVSANLPSLRPILTALFGDATFTSAGQRSPTGRRSARRANEFRAKNLRASVGPKSTNQVQLEMPHETYIRAGSRERGNLEESEGKQSLKKSDRGEGMKQVSVRKDIEAELGG